MITWLGALRRNSQLPSEPQQTAPGEMGAPKQQQSLCSLVAGPAVTLLGVISRKLLSLLAGRKLFCTQAALLYIYRDIKCRVYKSFCRLEKQFICRMSQILRTSYHGGEDHSSYTSKSSSAKYNFLSSGEPFLTRGFEHDCD